MGTGIIDKAIRLSSRFLHPGMVLLIDLALSLLSSLLVCVLANYASQSGSFPGSTLLVWEIACLVSSLTLFLVTGSYRKIVRHTTVRDLRLFVAISLAKALFCYAAVYCIGTFLGFCPVSGLLSLAMLCDAILTICLFSVFRTAVVTVYAYIGNYVCDTSSANRILIYGVGDKSISASTRLAKSTHYKVVGYLSFEASSKEYRIGNLQVFGVKSDEELSHLAESLKISAILFTNQREMRSEGNNLIPMAAHLGIRVLIFPEIDELVAGRLRKSSIREVSIEELLGREEIQISREEICRFVDNRTVLVTGAAGSIGSELCRILAGFGLKKLILFDNAETPVHNIRLELEESFPELDFVPVIGDVRSVERVDFAFRKYRPDVVFHAAAYKHVPLMEENPCEAVRVNVTGTRIVADKCIEYNVIKMVMISTDKAVNPTNIMGCSKRLAEIYVQALGKAVLNGKVEGKTRFVTTRFGNVLGSSGSVIPRFRHQIEKGGPVTVTHPDINRFFMTIPEACRLVMEAAALSGGNDIYVFDMGEPVKIDDLARKMISLAGFVPDRDIRIEYTGLRPGEKLYEEVLSSKENTSASFHKRIRVAHVREYDYNSLLGTFDALDSYSRKVDIPEMVTLMKRTVPEFISRNSEFEKFDK